ncbi:MAG: ATP-dependent zinc metalloprotease FtsH [Myxococcota bacterium]
MKSYSRSLFLWVFIALVVMLIFTMVGQDAKRKQQELTFPQVIQHATQHQIKEITVKGQDLYGTLENGTTFRAIGPQDSDYLLDQLADNDIVPNYEKEPEGGMMTVLTTALPLVLIFILFLLFMRQLQAGGGKAMSFGKSRAKLLSESTRKVTFDDVAGCDEAKEELNEIIQFLKEPRKFTRLGGRIPKGVLLMGPPGTGKTLLARAVAGEAAVPFFSISGSDFVEMFVGVGASRVRDLFEQGKKQAPCIIFVDEIDAVGRHRGAGMGGGHDEREQTLNALLVEMDGFESNEGVILMAATNRPDVLDPALLRPGRFDRRVVVGNPDVQGRKGILDVHTRRIPTAGDVDLEVLAKGTPGFSGADLENLVNEAALVAARNDLDEVDMGSFEHAKDKVSMGPERRSMVIPDKERRRTAFHEAGHAIVARILSSQGADPVHKVTIVPRGRALGLTQMLPTEDRFGLTYTQIKTQIAILMGGRVAEKLIFHDISTGAQNDLERATKMATSAISLYGMSDVIGPRTLTSDGEVFLGRDFGRANNYSEATGKIADEEVDRITREGESLATTILKQNDHILNRLAQILLEKETVEGDEFEVVVNDLKPVYPVPEIA